MAYRHTPVLLQEVREHLALEPNDHFIDGTLGGGGHTEVLLQDTAPVGNALVIDADNDALAATMERLKDYEDRLTYIRGNFRNLKQIYDEFFAVHNISGILLDLGFSSHELEGSGRGFSFAVDEPLDMRFDTRQSLTASDIVNTWPFDKLEKVLREYGEESLATEIVNHIKRARQQGPITKTKMLVQAVLPAFRKKLNTTKEIPWVGGRHPLTKTFQALRIAVNDELESLKDVLPQAVDILQPGGRIAVIAFHSLEDRIIKRFFQRESSECLCPPEQPTCTCGHTPSLKRVTKKPVRATEDEQARNPRSRSATLRVAEKITPNQ